jgi:hypothetical protein
MIFFNKKEQPKVLTQKEKLLEVFNSLNLNYKEKYAFLVNISNLLFNMVVEKFIPILENEHKKQLIDIQKEMVFYFIGISMKIYDINSYDILKLPNKTNIKLETIYKNYVTNILMNSINKNDKRNNLFNIKVDKNISISFIQLLVMIYYFENKEYTGSLFINYKKTYNNYIFITDECFDIIYNTLIKYNNHIEKYINSIDNTPKALIDTYYNQIQGLKEHI